MVIEDALDEAQKCPPGKDGATARKNAWAAIIEASGKSEPELVEELSIALSVQKITIRRWISGENTPRSLLFGRMRKHFKVATSDGFPYMEPEKPVDFASSKAAIWTMNQWIKSLEFADATFVCKGMMPMRAIDDSDIMYHLVQALIANENLKIYYVVVEGSAAEDAYELIIDELRASENTREILENVRKITLKKTNLEVADDVMGLTYSCASPFIVKYSDTYREMVGRQVNILYEVPVDVIHQSGRTGGPGLFAYLQLPVSYVREVWPFWAKFLSSQRYTCPAKSADNDKLPLQDISDKEAYDHFAYQRPSEEPSKKKS